MKTVEELTHIAETSRDFSKKFGSLTIRLAVATGAWILLMTSHFAIEEWGALKISLYVAWFVTFTVSMIYVGKVFFLAIKWKKFKKSTGEALDD